MKNFFGSVGYAFDAQKNQIAKGMAARIPCHPCGKALC
jgi:hypothetical protein